MTDTPSWQFEVEIHPSAWHFPAAGNWIAGWIWPGGGRLVTDLRVWIDHRVFLGLHGLPRPEIERRFKPEEGPPYAGFSFLLTPHAGASLLRLEARDPTGQWTEFFRTRITVDPAADSRPTPAPLSARLADLVPALLRLQSQRPSADLAMLADEVLSASLAEPLNALPNPPFHGALETPGASGWLRYGRLSITGWLAHRERRIMRLIALADAMQASAMIHGLPRHDIDGLFPDLLGHASSQFVGHADLPAIQSSPALLKIFAELDNGEHHLAFAQRFKPRIIAGADTMLPPLSRLVFFHAICGLLRSARRHHLAFGSCSSLIGAMKSAWGVYRAEAPAPVGNNSAASHFLLPESATTGPLTIWIVTHNLNFEGAPWFIFEYARHFSRQPGITVRVLSPSEGPLRQAFEEAGMTVDVLDLATSFKAGSPAAFAEALAAATAPLATQPVDLIVANTMVSFWAIHLAHRLGKASLLYVHESAAIRRFFEPIIAPALFETIEEAFRLATRVVFTADASRRVFNYLNTRGQFLLLPSWVDATRIERFIATTDKRTLRIKHGLDPDATVVINIGSVCERKGQHVFIRAIALMQSGLAAAHPGRKIIFPMIGARPGLYLESLQRELEMLGVRNAFFMSESGEIFDFYRLADIFVCTSFEESFPRVLLESALFGLPIVSSRVNGIPEMLAEDEAWLIPSGDRYALAEAMNEALTAHFAGNTARTDRARRSILARYHEANSFPLHVALARAVAEKKA